MYLLVRFLHLIHSTGGANKVVTLNMVNHIIKNRVRILEKCYNSQTYEE
jgi:hypothetical protein